MDLNDLQPGAEGRDTVIRGLRVIARILSLRDDFLLDLLLDKDDWSFVIKAHALLEGVVCTLIAMHLRKGALLDVLVEKVEMHARIDMTKALGVTTSGDRAAMHGLGKLRNRLVHNAKDTNFTFVGYFRNKDLKDHFSRTFGHGWADPIPGDGPTVSRASFVLANPKLAVFQSVMQIAMYVVTEASNINTETAIAALRQAAVATSEDPSAGPSERSTTPAAEDS